jgi:pimeloyl-ACP methyl ester carboxylesterase
MIDSTLFTTFSNKGSKMAYVDNNGVRISYRIDGSGPTITLVHGGFGYKEMWKEMGLVDDLKTDYQLVSIDLRGHGESDKPHTPEAYSMKKFVLDIVAVLDELEIPKAHYWGYSMGGWIGFGMVRYASDRLCSLISGGAQPIDSWTESWKSGWTTLLNKGEAETITAIENSLMNSTNSEIEPILKKWLTKVNQVDFQAMRALMTFREELNLNTYVEHLNVPCLLYGGDRDTGSWVGFEKHIEEIPNSTVVTIPGGHITAALSIQSVHPLLRSFLENIRCS